MGPLTSFAPPRFARKIRDKMIDGYAEMEDRLCLGQSGFNTVQVQVLLSINKEWLKNYASSSLVTYITSIREVPFLSPCWERINF